MDCIKINELMIYYLDNELNDNEKKMFDDHIKNCESCKHELDEIKAVISLCNDISDEELPTDFKNNLHKKLVEVKMQVGSKTDNIQKSENKKNLVRFMRIASSLAAIVLVFVFLRGMIGFGGLKNSKSEAPMESAKADMAKPAAMSETVRMEEPRKEESVSADAKASELKAKSVQNTQDAAGQAAQGSVGNAEQIFGMTDGNQNASTVNKYDKGQEPATDVSAARITSFTASAASNRSTGIELVAENPEEVSGEIKNMAATSNAVIFAGAVTEKEASMKAASDFDGTILTLKVSNSAYAQFEENIRKKYGNNSLKIDPLKVEDVSGKIQQLNNESVILENRINSIQNSKSNNSDELNLLNTQKNQIQEQINNLVNDTEYTIVRVLIKKK